MKEVKEVGEEKRKMMMMVVVVVRRKSAIFLHTFVRLEIHFVVPIPMRC